MSGEPVRIAAPSTAAAPPVDASVGATVTQMRRQLNLVRGCVALWFIVSAVFVGLYASARQSTSQSETSTCDYSIEACMDAINVDGSKIGGCGANFVGEWITKGCFGYYNDSSYADCAYYGTVNGLDVTAGIMARMDLTPIRVERRIEGWPKCS